MSATAVAKAPDGGTDFDRIHAGLPEPAREKWSTEDLRTIAATVCKGLTVSELKLVLSIGGKYDLDPLLHEIWGTRGKDGNLLIMVGRDGLLRNARRQDDYLGFEGDVVRENDVFRKKRTADGQVTIEHEYEGTAAKRGKILGAWAYVHQVGKPSTYFFAEWDEYAPTNPHPKNSWARNPSAMILKCPLSLCLRLAYNITGVVGEDEMAHVLEESAELTAGEGNGDVQGLQFSEAVEETIARAERLGHAGLSDRGAWSVKIGSTTPVDRLVAQANTDLDDYEARRTAPPTDATSEPDVPIDDAGLPDPQPPTQSPEAEPAEDPSPAAEQSLSVAAEVAVAAEELPVVRRTDVPHFHNADEAAAYWASHQLADEGAEEDEPGAEAKGLVGEPYITWYEDLEKNARHYEHPGCDGRTARWVVPLDDSPEPKAGADNECANCAQVLPLRAVPAYWMIKPHGKKRFETREAAEKALADFGRTGYRVVGLTASGKVVEDLGGGNASDADAPLPPEAADGPALEPAAQGTPVGGSEPDLPPSNPNEVEKLRRHLAILDELRPDHNADDEEAAEWKTERDMVEAKLAALGEQAAKNDPGQGSLL